jgi:hypothetical protein
MISFSACRRRRHHLGLVDAEAVDVEVVVVDGRRCWCCQRHEVAVDPADPDRTWWVGSWLTAEPDPLHSSHCQIDPCCVSGNGNMLVLERVEVGVVVADVNSEVTDAPARSQISCICALALAGSRQDVTNAARCMVRRVTIVMLLLNRWNCFDRVVVFEGKQVQVSMSMSVQRMNVLAEFLRLGD